MKKKRRRRSAEFKFRVALEAAKGQKTIGDIAQEYSVHPSQISAWKKRLFDEGAEVFRQGVNHDKARQSRREMELYEQIGRQKMELEWLKKKAALFD